MNNPILRFARNLLALTGIAALIAAIASAVYVDKRLHAASGVFKYGPARHIEYVSRILHALNRDIDSQAAEMSRIANEDNALAYDRLMDRRNAR